VVVNTAHGKEAFKQTGRGAVSWHNTIFAVPIWPGDRQSSDFRNNLFIGVDLKGQGNLRIRNSTAVHFKHADPHRVLVMGDPDLNVCDYNGYRIPPSAHKQPFEVNIGSKKETFATLGELSEKCGYEKHGATVPGFEIFRKCPDIDIGEGLVQYGEAHGLWMPHALDLRLKEVCSPVDAGCVLPNVNDGFSGKAPDLGAYETGEPLPHYGPRTKPPYAEGEEVDFALSGERR
jgi:hypothetical protein